MLKILFYTYTNIHIQWSFCSTYSCLGIVLYAILFYIIKKFILTDETSLFFVFGFCYIEYYKSGNIIYLGILLRISYKL